MASVSSLTLTAYRSYASARLDVAAQVVMLTGPNGAGKTNILEALSLLSPGRGLRKAKLPELQQFNSPLPWAVAAQLANDTHIGTGRDPNDPESTRRVVLVDGRKVQQAELAEHLSILWVTPAMDRLWTESPSARRRLLDQLVLTCDPTHATRVNRYEDALAERNRMLKDGRLDDKWLRSIEHTLATEGVAVAAARRELIRQLSVFLPEANYTSNFPTPMLSLDGIETWLDEAKALQVEDRLREELAQARKLDSITGITSLGPHRSDLLCHHAEKNVPAALGSTGEQKALLLRLILAQAELVKTTRKQAPILLLDEVGAHLDEPRPPTP